MFHPLSWSGRPARWLYFSAILELVLAAVFAVIALVTDDLGSGFLLTAGILGTTGLLLLLWARRMRAGYEEAQRLRIQGVPGTARIVGMSQTGVYLNEQPQVELNLEVTTSIQGPYPVVLKEWVPMIMLGRLTGGVPLPVKVDPANPNNLVIEWESAMSPAGAAPTAPSPQADTSHYSPSAREAEKERLLATGVVGTATVLSAKATGETDPEGRPVYDLMLQIEVPGKQPVQGPARTGIPEDRVDQLEPGDRVPLKVDPANPLVMTVDWEKA